MRPSTVVRSTTGDVASQLTCALQEEPDEPERADDSHHPLGMSVLWRGSSDGAPAAELQHLWPQRIQLRTAARGIAPVRLRSCPTNKSAIRWFAGFGPGNEVARGSFTGDLDRLKPNHQAPEAQRADPGAAANRNIRGSGPIGPRPLPVAPRRRRGHAAGPCAVRTHTFLVAASLRSTAPSAVPEPRSG